MNRFSLIWKNSTRKPVRFLLTSLSVLVAFFLFTILSGIGTALDSKINSSNEQRLMTTHKISMTRSLPLNYKNKIKIIDGVSKVTYSSWFGGFFQNEKNQLAQFAVGSENYFEMFPEYLIEKSRLEGWKSTRTGIIIGQAVAEKFDWKVGDKVPIQSSIWMNNDNSFTWEFEVSAIYQTGDVSTDTNQVFFNHLYFDDYRGYMRNTAGWLTTQIDVNSDLDKIVQSIDKLFENSSMETRTTSEQVFLKELAQQFVDMSILLKIVLSAVFFTLLLIACNTMIQSIRERMNEIAMMKAIGFSSSKLIVDTYLESVVLLAIGALTGTFLAVMSLGLVRQKFAEFLPGIDVLPEHYFAVTVSILIFAIVCTFYPAIRIKRLAISETLGSKI